MQPSMTVVEVAASTELGGILRIIRGRAEELGPAEPERALFKGLLCSYNNWTHEEPDEALLRDHHARAG